MFYGLVFGTTVQKPNLNGAPLCKHFGNTLTLAKIGILGSLQLCGAMVAAHEAVTLPVESIWQSNAMSWTDHNRFLEIFSGQHQQNYREIDTYGLTGNSTLDSESGDQRHAGLALRWQTTGGWLLHLQAQRQNGATDYDGYLQAGNGSLAPYRARTGNTASQISINLGYALNTNTWSVLPETWQVTSLVHFGRHRWTRNLVQYSETYDYTTHAIGAMLQWQFRPGTVLEAQVLEGRTRPASVRVPALGFAAEQPAGSLREWQIGVIQNLGALTRTQALEGWRVTARYTDSQYKHGASPVINGLQAPPNQHRPRTWTLGLQKQF
jgi:hypothetical protein